jgi:dihydroflavonol-4-reductase
MAATPTIARNIPQPVSPVANSQMTAGTSTTAGPSWAMQSINIRALSTLAKGIPAMNRPKALMADWMKAVTTTPRANARDGTRRAVGAALKAGVKRVVVTSSVAAATPRAGAGESVSDETVWTDLDDPKVSAYSRSKTLAERTSWDLIGASSGATTLATVNPSVVLGPVLSRDFSESVQVVERLLSGRVPGLPRLGFSIVDVRDVADLHIRAMTAPEAAGQRFIAAGDFAWMVDLAALLRARLGDAANKVPTRKVPDLVVRLAALFDKSLAAVAPRLGEQRAFTSAKAQKVLGWRPRSLEETVLDCARSLIATGAV